jgi:RecA/RadA recombinase
MTKTSKKKEPQDRLTAAEVMKGINKKFGWQVVRTADNTEDTKIFRRPTGLAQLDLALAGGFPGGTMSVIAGIEGVGKDALLNSLFRTHQEIFGEASSIFLNANEPGGYDKIWARKMGVKVALSDEELDNYGKARGFDIDPATRKEMKTQLGEFLISNSSDAEEVFTTALRLGGTGACKLIAINSLQNLLPHVNLEEDSVEDSGSGLKEAYLLTQFTKKWGKSIALHDHMEKKEYSDAKERPWYATVICAKQARANIGAKTFRSKEYKTNTGAHAFRHAVSMSIDLSTVFQEGGKEDPEAKKIRWFLSKGKHGTHEGLFGQMDLYYSSGFDQSADVLDALALKGMLTVEGKGVITVNVPGIELVGTRGQILSRLRVEQELLSTLYKAVMGTLGVPFRLREDQ